MVYLVAWSGGADSTAVLQHYAEASSVDYPVRAISITGHPQLLKPLTRRQTVGPSRCPSCGVTPFDQFLPGFVERWGRVWWAPWRKRAPYAVICRDCKEVVGWEWDERRERGEDA